MLYNFIFIIFGLKNFIPTPIACEGRRSFKFKEYGYNTTDKSTGTECRGVKEP